MKKFTKYILIALGISLLMSMTAMAYQASPIQKPDALPGIQPEELVDENGELTTTNLLAERFLPRFALCTIGVVGALSILFLTIGGVRFAMSYGNDESIESAKRQITWSITGFLISILSYTIVSIIVNLDFGDDDPELEGAQLEIQEQEAPPIVPEGAA